VSDCIFCRIVAGEIPADVVHDGERVLAFRDINPQAPTHVQIIPKKHVPHITAFDAADDDGAWLSELIEVANLIAANEGLDKGFRLVINNGPLSGQSVFHVHLHILGGRQLGWPPG
jgi:histidine triad (HIT) family protein